MRLAYEVGQFLKLLDIRVLTFPSLGLQMHCYLLVAPSTSFPSIAYLSLAQFPSVLFSALDPRFFIQNYLRNTRPLL